MRYVSVVEAKEFLGDNGDNDIRITMLIEMASAAVSDFCNRDFQLKTAEEFVRGLDSRVLFPKRTPIVSVTSVVLGSRELAFTHDENCITISGHRIRNDEKVKVNYTGGFAEIPSNVKWATLLTAKAFSTANIFDQNMTGESIGGVISGSYSQLGPGSLPTSARNTLISYTRSIGF